MLAVKQTSLAYIQARINLDETVLGQSFWYLFAFIKLLGQGCHFLNVISYNVLITKLLDILNERRWNA